jgi:hypothetical protein
MINLQPWINLQPMINLQPRIKLQPMINLQPWINLQPMINPLRIELRLRIDLRSAICPWTSRDITPATRRRSGGMSTTRQSWDVTLGPRMCCSSWRWQSRASG